MLEADYLVVGAGAAGLAFVDELITHSDASVVMVERREGPGGHWNDAYPFVRLHQPSANYGVNSRSLGNEVIDTTGLNAGCYGRATGPEICGYFRQVLDSLLTSGQVRFFGMCDYSGNWVNQHTVTSRVTGTTSAVRVRRRIVDTTYLDVKVPATHKPSFTVDSDACLVPVGDLVNVAGPPSGFTVLGAGKTAMDACTWLLEHGVDADRIRWIRPREAWVSNRACHQPLDLLGETIEATNASVACLAHAASLPDLFGQLEQVGTLLRLDPGIEPSAFRGAFLTEAEVTYLRQIKRVVRRGRVRRVSRNRIVLSEGEIPTDSGEIHVDCTASGFRSAPPRPIFESGRITLQSLIGGLTTYHAALVAFIEATRDSDAERNRLTPPTAQPAVARDWVARTRGVLRSSALHGAEPDLAEWVDRSRLSLTYQLSEMMSAPRVAAAVAHSGQHTELALKNANTLLTAAS